MKQSLIEHRFVEFVPSSLEDGVLYISIPYKVCVHSCCCGCQNKVVTPLEPIEWRLTFDGETVSLYPSIGNWSFPCQSHYWIKRGEVIWDRKFSEDEIASVQRKARTERARLEASVDVETADTREKRGARRHHRWLRWRR